MKNQAKKLKPKKEKSIPSRMKDEALKEVGKGLTKGVKPEQRKKTVVREVDRRVQVDRKGTKVQVYKGDERTDEQVVADYNRKYNK